LISELRREDARVGEPIERAEEAEPALGMRGRQQAQEQPLEHPREHLDGQEEARPAGDPARAISRGAGRGLCPEAWCSWRGLASMFGWAGTHQLAVAGRLKMGFNHGPLIGGRRNNTPIHELRASGKVLVRQFVEAQPTSICPPLASSTSAER
jgi:hypothetical protein